MKIQIKNNLEMYPPNKSSLKLTTFNNTIAIRRVAKRYLSQQFPKTNLGILTKCIMGLMVMTVIFSFKSFTISKQEDQNLIVGKWVWKESIHVDNKRYLTNPKLTGYGKKIVFTSDGNVITYKNDIEIRISKYQFSKGSSVFDQKEHNLITFEGATYVIEQLNSKNLTLANNDSNGFRSFFYR